MSDPRALVVEDDPSWQAILQEILEDCGLAVDVVDTFDGAMKELRQRAHRLSILDLSLGGVDHTNQEGLSVLEALRKYDPTCTPIFLTGFATVELAVDIIQKQGAFTCLRKESFRRAAFREVVYEALAHSAALARSSVPLKPLVDETAPLIDKEVETGKGSIEALALVVEDDAGWRDLLAELMGEAGFQPKVCSSYVEALGWLKREAFRLAVIDLSLASSLNPSHNQDGFRLLAHTREANIPTIIVSGYAEPGQIEAAYTDYGLYACLEKQAFDRKVFLETVRSAGKKVGAGELDPILQQLTGREREVLGLLGRGLTNKEIAQELYLSPNTVKRHVKSLFSKLDVNTRAAAAVRAQQLGI